MRTLILDFLSENPDYMLVCGYGQPGMKLVKDPHGNLLPLIGPLKAVHAHELSSELYELEKEGLLTCDEYTYHGCTLEMRYTFKVHETLAA